MWMTLWYAGWNKFHPAYHTETDKYNKNKLFTKLALFTRYHLVLLPCRYSVVTTEPNGLISQKTNLFPNQALNKMLGVGWLLRRPGHGLEAAHVGFVVVRRNVAACWHSYCIFGRCVMKIWAKQPSRLLWGSLMFLCPAIGYCGLGHDHFPTSTYINW
jgi:hypothetical protein